MESKLAKRRNKDMRGITELRRKTGVLVKDLRNQRFGRVLSSNTT